MAKAKLLIADDDPELLEAVKIRFSRYGFAVLTATGGEEAMRLARREQPDVIVLDINMPRGNGHAVARRLKGDPEVMATPIIFLTASIAEADIEAAWSAGVEKYITKPFQAEELVLAVEESLQRCAAVC